MAGEAIIVLWDTDCDGKRHGGGQIHSAIETARQTGKVDAHTLPEWASFPDLISNKLQPAIQDASSPPPLYFLIHTGEDHAEQAVKELADARGVSRWKELAKKATQPFVHILLYSAASNPSYDARIQKGQWIAEIRFCAVNKETVAKQFSKFSELLASDPHSKALSVFSDDSTDLSRAIHDLISRTASLSVDLETISGELTARQKLDAVHDTWQRAIGPDHDGYLVGPRRGGQTLLETARAIQLKPWAGGVVAANDLNTLEQLIQALPTAEPTDASAEQFIKSLGLLRDQVAAIDEALRKRLTSVKEAP